MQLTKKDWLITFFIGEISAWLLILMVNNLELNVEFIKQGHLYWILPIFFPIFCLIWIKLISLISQKKESLFQFGKFVLVGGFNFLVDIGILNLLIFFSGIAVGYWYSVFKGISFLVANINSYLFNKNWAFSSKEKDTGKQFLTFFLVSVVGLIVNNIVASGIVNLVGPQFGLNAGQWGNIGAIVASMVAMGWNFIGYKMFVFKK